MISKTIEQIERLALRMRPENAIRLLGTLPLPTIEKLQRARFRRTLRLVAERSTFYRGEFRRRGIDVRRIRYPAELGDFFTTGEELRAHGGEEFLTGRADTAFETTGTTSPLPKRVFFSHQEISEIGRTSALALHLLGLRAEDTVLSAFDCSFWISPVVVRSAFQYIDCSMLKQARLSRWSFTSEHSPISPL